VEVCPKCKARLIDEEADNHECDIPLKVSGRFLLLRDSRGFWRRYPLSEATLQKIGEIPPELRVEPDESFQTRKKPNPDRDFPEPLSICKAIRGNFTARGI